MSDKKLKEKLAKRIVVLIIDDLKGRQLLGDVFEEISEEIQKEIKETWKSIVLNALEKE